MTHITPSPFDTLLYGTTCLLTLFALGCQPGEDVTRAEMPSDEEDTSKDCVLTPSMTPDAPHVLTCGETRIELRDGQDGAPGKDGEPGTDGAMGLKGQDGAGIVFEEIQLEPGDETCEEGGVRLEVRDAQSMELLSSREVCHARCSRGERYDPNHDQCLKVVDIAIEGFVWRIEGDVPERWLPDTPITPDPLGVGGGQTTPCHGTLTLPFDPEARSLTSTSALYELGHSAIYGFTMEIEGRRYARDASRVRRPLSSSMTRQLIQSANATNRYDLEVELVQTGLEGATPEQEEDIAMRLVAGTTQLPYDPYFVDMPLRAIDWRIMLGDGIREAMSLHVDDPVTQESGSIVCRIIHFERLI